MVTQLRPQRSWMGRLSPGCGCEPSGWRQSCSPRPLKGSLPSVGQGSVVPATTPEADTRRLAVVSGGPEGKTVAGLCPGIEPSSWRKKQNMLCLSLPQPGPHPACSGQLICAQPGFCSI